MNSVSERLLAIENLHISYSVSQEMAQAVTGVTLTLLNGEALAVIGESNCGKSSLIKAVACLLPEPVAKIESGSILFQEEELLTKSEKEMSTIRGKKIVFLGPHILGAFNPWLTIGRQLSRLLKFIYGIKEQKEQSIILARLFRWAELDNKREILSAFPSHLTVLQKLKLIIALTLIPRPRLLLLDELSYAVDLTDQIEAVKLLIRLKKKIKFSIMVTSHDPRPVFSLVDRIAVIYSGAIVETANKHRLLKNPLHPYSEALLNALPDQRHGRENLYELAGEVAQGTTKVPAACLFAPRCRYRKAICDRFYPKLIRYRQHNVRCWRYSHAAADHPHSGYDPFAPFPGNF